ncbi:response regulator, partial [Candidatus Peregrinibacteria bacterium]|nr:response regulator [Candidatus Peregrinibacteria bacterium]
VEDNEDSMAIMTRALEKDYLVVKAANGKEALEKTFSEKPDLILLDISLPILDGLSVARRIRCAGETENVPIIAVSASVMPNNVKDALAAGCNGFLAKPVRPRILIEKVKEYE